MRTRFAIPAIALAAALSLTGCVNNAAPTSSKASPEASDNATAVDAAAAAFLPDDIKAAGKLVIGVDAAYPPNESKNADGEPVGWDVELADAMAAKLGLTTDWKISSFDNIIPSITGGTMDLGVSSFTDTVEREQQVDFVNYFTAGVLWASPKGKTVDPDNACGLTVAVQATTFEETDEVPAKSKACTDAGKKAINILKFGSQDEATNALVLGRADAMSADSPVTEYAISQTKGKLQAAGKTFEEAPYGIAVAKNSNGLDKAVQAALQSMVKDGSYLKILTKWGVASGAITNITINAASKG